MEASQAKKVRMKKINRDVSAYIMVFLHFFRWKAVVQSVNILI